MATRNIIERGDETLGKVCREVTRFDPRLHQLLDDMRETLAQANGYGLAAPQVGILRRVCLVTGSDGEVIELVNPEIIEQSGEQEGPEGCLSVPGSFGMVKRPSRVAGGVRGVFVGARALRLGQAAPAGEGPGPGPKRQGL